MANSINSLVGSTMTIRLGRSSHTLTTIATEASMGHSLSKATKIGKRPKKTMAHTTTFIEMRAVTGSKIVGETNLRRHQISLKRKRDKKPMEMYMGSLERQGARVYHTCASGTLYLAL